MKDKQDLKNLILKLQCGINLKRIELETIEANKAKLLKRLSGSNELTFGEFKEFYQEVQDLRKISKF